MILKNAKIISEGNDTIIRDIKINNGVIEAIGVNFDDDEVIDLNNKLVISGGIDVHVHLREPGFENKETIASGCDAARRGGYTTIMAMPNVNPYPSDIEVMNHYKRLIDTNKKVNVIPYCTITKDEKGLELVDFKTLTENGYYYFSDDGVGVKDEAMMLKAMQEASKYQAMIVAHCEDKSYLKPKAALNERISKKFKVNGISNISEYAQVERDLLLAQKSGVKYHICHMSCKESVELLRIAKKNNSKVSGEVSAHHLLLNENDVKDTNYKMNPPLRSVEDQKALIEGINDNTIEIIASDHAPHTIEDKAKSMEDASFGIIGLETTIPLIYTYLVDNHIITLEKFQNLISSNPARIFNLKNKGKIEKGYDADLCVLDEEETIIDVDKMYSKARNTPFNNIKVKTDIYMTIKDGKIIYKKED